MKFKLFFDILRDKNSEKFSLTKFSTLLTMFMIVLIDTFAIVIMVQTKQVDHFVLLENFAFAATLMGFKNYGRKIEIKDTKPKKNKKDDSGLNHFLNNEK